MSVPERFPVVCAQGGSSHGNCTVITGNCTAEVFCQSVETDSFWLSFMYSGMEYKYHYSLVYFKSERRPFVLER